jgi:hypothetical protein
VHRGVPCALPKALPEALPADPDLAAVVAAWPALPRPARDAILMLIGAARR